MSNQAPKHLQRAARACIPKPPDPEDGRAVIMYAWFEQQITAALHIHTAPLVTALKEARGEATRPSTIQIIDNALNPWERECLTEPNHSGSIDDQAD